MSEILEVGRDEKVVIEPTSLGSGHYYLMQPATRLIDNLESDSLFCHKDKIRAVCLNIFYE